MPVISHPALLLLGSLFQESTFPRSLSIWHLHCFSQWEALREDQEAWGSQGIPSSLALPWAVSLAAAVSFPGMPYLLWPQLPPGSHCDDPVPAQFFRSLVMPSLQSNGWQQCTPLTSFWVTSLSPVWLFSSSVPCLTNFLCYIKLSVFEIPEHSFSSLV